MEKQMYLETRGTVVYLVVRGNKQLNAPERKNLNRWGFIPQDSARRVYALGFNRETSVTDSMVATLHRYGFVLTDNVPVCALTNDGVPREVASPADRHLLLRESSFAGLRNAGIIPTQSRTFQRCGKINPALTDEESHRYSRSVECGYHYNSKEAFSRSGREQLPPLPTVHPNAAFLVWVGAL
jgi:hypothetical protein